jgi:hypothetical protein
MHGQWQAAEDSSLVQAVTPDPNQTPGFTATDLALHQGSEHRQRRIVGLT